MCEEAGGDKRMSGADEVFGLPWIEFDPHLFLAVGQGSASKCSLLRLDCTVNCPMVS